MADKIETLTESDGIALGDIVKLKKDNSRAGYISSIIDYGTHIAFFIDFGDFIKFPARREWIKLLKKANENENESHSL